VSVKTATISVVDGAVAGSAPLDPSTVAVTSTSAGLIATNNGDGTVTVSSTAVGTNTFGATIADTAGEVSPEAIFTVEVLPDGGYVFPVAVSFVAPAAPGLVSAFGLHASDVAAIIDGPTTQGVNAPNTNPVTETVAGLVHSHTNDPFAVPVAAGFSI